jgi:hypothetical protein
MPVARSSAPSRARKHAKKQTVAAARPRRAPEVEEWIRREVAMQEKLYRRIVRDMEALNTLRIQWVREFYQRIQTRGFSVHAGIRRKVRPEEIPPIPKRIRVVF